MKFGYLDFSNLYFIESKENIDTQTINSGSNKIISPRSSNKF